MKRPIVDEILKVRLVLKGAGLKKVIIQKNQGYIRP